MRDERLAEAKKAMDDAIAESTASYTEALAEADKTLKKAKEEAYKTFNKGLAEAQQTLQRALLDAQKDYEKAIDEINKSTQKKLNDLMAKLREVAAAMAAISAGSAKGVIASAPSYTPVVASSITTKPNTTVTPDGTVVVTPTTPQTPVRAVAPDGSVASWRAGEELSMAKLTINQNFTNVTADAWDIHEKTLSAIRYGTAITPKPSPSPAISNLDKRTGGSKAMML
jgi:tetratricopeptide (TPR) repeat protein